MRNLLSNAIKFTPQGGSVSISASMEESPNIRGDGARRALRIAVTDTGAGISKVSDAPVVLCPDFVRLVRFLQHPDVSLVYSRRI